MYCRHFCQCSVTGCDGCNGHTCSCTAQLRCRRRRRHIRRRRRQRRCRSATEHAERHACTRCCTACLESLPLCIRVVEAERRWSSQNGISNLVGFSSFKSKVLHAPLQTPPQFLEFRFSVAQTLDHLQSHAGRSAELTQLPWRGMLSLQSWQSWRSGSSRAPQHKVSLMLMNAQYRCVSMGVVDICRDGALGNWQERPSGKWASHRLTASRASPWRRQIRKQNGFFSACGQACALR